MGPEQTKMSEEIRLESWKEIGAYLERDARTVQRWEKDEDLPVHRHSHKLRASVYAYPSEIDAWRAGRKVVPESVARPLWKMPAFAVTLALCLVMVGNGVRPQGRRGAAGGTCGPPDLERRRHGLHRTGFRRRPVPHFHGLGNGQPGCAGSGYRCQPFSYRQQEHPRGLGR